MIKHRPHTSSHIVFLSPWVVTLMLLVTTPVRSETVTTKHGNGNIEEKYSTDKDGRKHGSYASYYESGKKKVRCRYSSGQLNGTYTEYHENGKTRLKKSYKKGQLSGTLTLYDEEGSVLHRAAYKKEQVFLYGGPRSLTPYAVYPLPREKIVETVTALRPRNYEGKNYTKEKFEVEASSKKPLSTPAL